MSTKRLFLAALGGAAVSQIAPSFGIQKPVKTEQEKYWPDSVLQTHDGKEVRFYSDLIKNRIVIINAMYTVCSGVCPANTASLLALQKALGERVGKDIFIYSISLQPDIDSPSALKDYAERYDIQPGWTFLTGKASDIDIIRRKLGFYDSDPVADANLSNHSGVFRIGNDLRNRWFMTPAATPTKQIMASVLNVIQASFADIVAVYAFPFYNAPAWPTTKPSAAPTTSCFLKHNCVISSLFNSLAERRFMADLIQSKSTDFHPAITSTFERNMSV